MKSVIAKVPWVEIAKLVKRLIQNRQRVDKLEDQNHELLKQLEELVEKNRTPNPS
jgi:sensor histidine kinase regulating citrate/malate metabolism